MQRQYALLEVQYRQGLKTKRDVLRIETEVRRQDLSIITRDNEVDLNFQKLANAVGLSLDELNREDLEPEEAKPFATLAPVPAELKAQDHRLARILAYDQKAQELNTSLVDRNRLPQIGISADAGYHLNDYLGNSRDLYKDTTYTWEALLTLKYNLWDFGTRRRNVEIARVQAVNTELDHRQTLLNLTNDLRDLWNKHREFTEDVRLSRELLVLEQQSYNLLEIEYHAGRTTYLDLIASLNSLFDARSKSAASFYGLRKTQLLYAFHKGVLYETLK